MIGADTDRKLHVKGGEAWSVLQFLKSELRLAKPYPDRAAHRKGVNALVIMNDIFHGCGWVVGREEQRAAHEYYNEYLDVARVLDIETPKTHLGAHMMSDLDWFGNPARYAAWVEEGWNRTMKGCARGLSQATFDVCLLSAVNEKLKAFHERPR